MNAIVSLGYCSAAFVSPDGLTTNYHCVERDFIQPNSSKITIYLKMDSLLEIRMMNYKLLRAKNIRHS